MRTKLLLAILSTVSTLTAFADNPCIATTPDQYFVCIQNDFNARVITIKSDTQNVYNINHIIATTVYNMRQGQISKFNWNAFKEATPYAAAILTTTAQDAKNISEALKSGDLDSIPALTAKYQADRYALFKNNAVNDAAYFAAYNDSELMAKIQGISSETTELRSENYATNMAVSYLAPATLYNMYYFIGKDTVKYTNGALDSMTQAMCETKVQVFQTKFANLDKNNTNINMLIDSGAPNSIVKTMLSLAKADYAVDALNTMYGYTTGKSPTLPNQSYDICDYNTFQQAVSEGNVYAKQLNTTINSIISQTRSHVPAQNIYWALTAASAQALDTMFPQSPVAVGASRLPY